jgi:hypothetical protein
MDAHFCIISPALSHFANIADASGDYGIAMGYSGTPEETTWIDALHR